MNKYFRQKHFYVSKAPKFHLRQIVKRYGFNVGVDNHNYKLFGEDEILELCSRRSVFDENIYS